MLSLFYFRIWNTDDRSQIYTDVCGYFWIEMYRSKLLKDASRLIKTSLRRSRSAITAEENFQREKYFLFVFARFIIAFTILFCILHYLGDYLPRQFEVGLCCLKRERGTWHRKIFYPLQLTKLQFLWEIKLLVDRLFLK